jgi:anti-anti-sigma factor
MEKNFQINLEGTTLKVKVGFELTRRNAPVLQELLNSYKGQNILRIVFDTTDLVFISSAGIRCVIFAIQELGQKPEIIFLNCAKEIIETFKMSGLIRFIKFIEDENKHVDSDDDDFRKKMEEIRQQELDDFAANNDVVCYQMKIGEED